MSRCVISVCGSRGLPNNFSMRSEKWRCHAYRAVRLDLHALIAAQRHEVIEIQLKAARNQIDNLANLFK